MYPKSLLLSFLFFLSLFFLLSTSTPTNPILPFLSHQSTTLPASESASLRRLQTTFTILPPSSNDTICARTITHNLIALYRGINPSSPTSILPGILWENLLINNRPCQRSELSTTATWITSISGSDMIGSPDTISPWFASGRDNSERICETFRSTFPAEYFFTDDLPRFRQRLVRGRILPENVAKRALRGVIYMFAIEFKPDTDGTIRRAKTCVYVDASAPDIDITDGDQPAPTPAPLIMNTTDNGNDTISTVGDDNEDDDPKPTEEDSGPACFPSYTLVSMYNGQLVNIQDIQVGDNVIHGGLVIGRTHANEKIIESFVQISVKSEKKEILALSKQHLIPVKDKGLIPAEVVKIGDYVFLENGSVASVEDVRNVKRNGLFAPVTMSGYLVVQGIRVCCYTNVMSVSSAHAALMPLRLIVMIGGKVDVEGVFEYLRKLHRLWKHSSIKKRRCDKQITRQKKILIDKKNSNVWNGLLWKRTNAWGVDKRISIR